MKKFIALLTLLTLILSVVASMTACSCNGNTEPPATATSIRVGYFAGTTGLGMTKMIHEGNHDYVFTKYSGPDTIIPAFARGEIDIAALPTNAAPNVDKATDGKAQLLAINTLGVLYVCTNGVTITSIDDLAGKSIYVPEAAPKLVLKHVLDAAHVEGYTLLDEYNLDTLPAALVSGQAPIALLPEPKVTVAENLYKKAQSEKQEPENNFAIALDVTAEWNKVSTTPVVQGCVIVNREFAANNPALIAAFLADYKESVQFMTSPSDLTAAAGMAVDLGLLPSLAVAKAAIPRSNLTLMTGDTMKQAAIGFYTALNMTDPGESFYYIPQN